MTVMKGRITNASKVRLLSVSAIFVVSGLAAYIYNGLPLDLSKTDLSIPPHASQIKVADTAKTVSKKSDVIAAGGVQMARPVVRNKGVAMVRNDARISDSRMEKQQHQINTPVNSSLLSESILSSRARIRKMAVASHAGLSLEQRRTQLKYQVAASKQQLSLLRNQLRQLELIAHRPKSGKAAPEQKSVNTSILKSRVHQLETQLARHLQDLKLFQKQFSAAGQYARRSSMMLQHRAHHRFN